MLLLNSRDGTETCRISFFGQYVASNRRFLTKVKCSTDPLGFERSGHPEIAVESDSELLCGAPSSISNDE